MKIGRNDTCPCNSGKKYKKCCLNNNFDEFVESMKERISAPEDFQKDGLLIGRPMISTSFQGHKVVAVGSRLYPKLPLNITFHEFIVTLLKDVLGLDWGLEESHKPISERHLIIRWIQEMASLLGSPEARLEDAERNIRSVEVSGNVQSLLALAYDVYCIWHGSELPQSLLDRLKNRDQFQGAKYEISVAGIFARAGFDIHWLPESSEPHAEFIAAHRETREKITVEAKSRHRQGVLYTPAITAELDNMKTNVKQIFSRAIKKPDEGNPFIIFIDVNLPLTTDDATLNKVWVKDIQKMINKRPEGKRENPDQFSTLFVTNFSWHYSGENKHIKRGETLTVIPAYPKIRLENDQTISLLHIACEQYGWVPAFFPTTDK